MDSRTFLQNVRKASGLEASTCLSCQEALTEIIEQALLGGDTVSIPSFGNFEPHKRNERVMSHPSLKGKKLLIPPKVVVNFKPSAILKTKIK